MSPRLQKAGAPKHTQTKCPASRGSTRTNHHESQIHADSRGSTITSRRFTRIHADRPSRVADFMLVKPCAAPPDGVRRSKPWICTPNFWVPVASYQLPVSSSSVRTGDMVDSRLTLSAEVTRVSQLRPGTRVSQLRPGSDLDFHKTAVRAGDIPSFKRRPGQRRPKSRSDPGWRAGRKPDSRTPRTYPRATVRTGFARSQISISQHGVRSGDISTSSSCPARPAKIEIWVLATPFYQLGPDEWAPHAHRGQISILITWQREPDPLSDFEHPPAGAGENRDLTPTTAAPGWGPSSDCDP